MTLAAATRELKKELDRLRKEKQKIEDQIEQYETALSALGDLAMGSQAKPKKGKKKAKRHYSAAARKRISDAQKRRWAKHRKKGGVSKR